MIERRAAPLLITGCYRTGTTIVEKIVNMHPHALVASQPFPVLYFQVKERFNRQIGLDPRYPLGHLFLESAYAPWQFDQFLENCHMDADQLASFCGGMVAYPQGLWTPEMLGILEQLTPAKFFEVYSQLIDCVGQLFPSSGARYVGGKEVLVEEYARFLIAKGARVIFVVRDPRAMITSLNFRDRDNLTGDHRPVLYSLRIWRKSVALALEALESGRALLVKYEDLVLNQKKTLSRITEFLDLEPYAKGAFDQGITDQYGRQWRGNSSFADRKGIYENSVRKFEERLPEAVRDFIEMLCLPEMELLGYEPLGALEFDERIVEGYADSFETIHKSFPSDYSSDSERLANEIERIRLLSGGGQLLDEEEQRKWFITTSAYRVLKEGAVKR